MKYAGLLRRPETSIVAVFSFSQGLVLLGSLVRIPLIVDSVGPSGYGLLLAITALNPWLLLFVAGLTSLTRVGVAESLGAASEASAWDRLEALRVRSHAVGGIVLLASVGLAVLVPWDRLLLRPGGTATIGEVRLGVAFAGALAATAAPGAVYLGLLHAKDKVALTSLLPGIAAAVSLLATTVAALTATPMIAFVISMSVASCAPFWFGHILGLKYRRRLRADAGRPAESVGSGWMGAKALVIMTGAAAPPLFSTGWDPIVLGAATNPKAVATYGLATRIALIVSLAPAALYPHLWAKYARLRAREEIPLVRAELRRDIARIGGATTMLAMLYIIFGPYVGGV